MSQEIARKSDDELLVTYPIRGTAPDWFFRLDETSAGAWKVSGTDRWGRTVSITGHDEEDLLSRAESQARKISNSLDTT